MKLKQIQKIAGDFAPSVVHANDVWRNEYAMRSARKQGVPWVAHLRGPLQLRDYGKHKVRYADAVISIAERHIIDAMNAGISPKKIYTVGDAVDTETFISGLAPAPHTRPKFMLVGRIEPEKRVLDAVKVFAQLPLEVGSLHIFGSPTDRSYADEIEEYIRANHLGNRVALEERISPNGMPAALAEHDVLLSQVAP
ncbi:glycosyltransferase family 4 protein [Nitratireductor aquibiodomus]|nr:glycosyltransferase family 4 protein [Nitratireductor aquibiodomus]